MIVARVCRPENVATALQNTKHKPVLSLAVMQSCCPAVLHSRCSAVLQSCSLAVLLAARSHVSSFYNPGVTSCRTTVGLSYTSRRHAVQLSCRSAVFWVVMPTYRSATCNPNVQMHPAICAVLSSCHLALLHAAYLSSFFHAVMHSCTPAILLSYVPAVLHSSTPRRSFLYAVMHSCTLAIRLSYVPAVLHSSTSLPSFLHAVMHSCTPAILLS